MLSGIWVSYPVSCVDSLVLVQERLWLYCPTDDNSLNASDSHGRFTEDSEWQDSIHPISSTFSVLLMAETDVYNVSILGKDSIYCGFHLAPYIARTVLDTLPASTYVLVTDTNIASLHLDAFKQGFQEELSRLGKQSRFFSQSIRPGETSKSREGKAAIEDFLLLNRCTRDTVILALGGGVIGDLVGFVAATLYVHFARTSICMLLSTHTTAACAVCASYRFRRHSWLWSTPA